MDAIKAEQDYGAKALEYCKIQQTGNKGKVAFPTIRPGTEEWRIWEAYFIDFLGFEPVMMKLVRAGRFAAMTVPAQFPEWLDTDYARLQADGPTLSRTRPQEPDRSRVAQHRANVFVPADNALYPQMVDRSRTADERDFRHDQNGIWVARGWVDIDVPTRTRAKRFTLEDLQRLYARNEVAA